MVELVSNCPRCRSKNVSFDVAQINFLREEYRWQRWYEAFSICRNCSRSTVFFIAQKGSDNTGLDIYHFRANSPLELKKSLNNYFKVEGYVSLKDTTGVTPPEHLPTEIEKVFNEGATCCATQCWNAAGAMFRTCIDLATRPLLPKEETQGLNSRTRRDLGLRLPWLFQAGLLPAGLQELSDCVREDGNDGAHQGTLTEEDAEDLLDFTTAILERLYTEPQRVELAKARREERRNR